MKKALSLFLALVLCLGLCACGGGSNSKYVGVYEWEFEGPYDDEFYSKLILNGDHSGSYTQEITPSSNPGITSIYEKCDVTWKVVDDYLVVYYSGKRYDLDGTSKTLEYSESYELKGNKLFKAGSDYTIITKTR